MLNISEYPSDDVVKVKLEYEGENTVIFYDEDDKLYKVEGYEDVEINQSTAKNAFYTASYVRAEDIIKDDLKNLSEYGLDIPTAKVTAVYKDGKSNTFLFGNTVPGSGTYYMIMEGLDKIVNVWNNYGNNAKLNINKLRILEKHNFTIDEMSIIRIYKNDEIHLEITNNIDRKQVGIGLWYLTAPYVKGLHTDENSKTYLALAEEVLTLGPSKILSTDADFEEYELDKPWGTLELVPITGETISILFGKNTDGYAAMKYANSDIIYSISQRRLSFFDYNAIDIIERLLTLVNIKKVSSLELTGVAGDVIIEIIHEERTDDEGNAKLDGNGNPITDDFYVIEGKLLDEDLKKQGSWFYQALLKPKIVREVKDENYNAGRMIGSIIWILMDEPYQFSIEIYYYDEYFYAVKILDNDVLLLVNKKEIDILPEYYQDLKNNEMEDPFN